MARRKAIIRIDWKYFLSDEAFQFMLFKYVITMPVLNKTYILSHSKQKCILNNFQQLD